MNATRRSGHSKLFQAVTAAVLLTGAGCSDRGSGSSGDAASGGHGGSGGTQIPGEDAGADVVRGSGGTSAPGSGGALGSGGKPGPDAAVGSGGSVSNDSATGTGGRTGSDGAAATGGRTTSDGAAATGGSVVNDAATATGGRATPDANNGSGGKPGTGGSAGRDAPTGTGGVIDGGGTANGNYVLPADRATTWNLAGLLSKGGIPSASWPMCNTTPLAPSGKDDDSALINSAIAGCNPGTVVSLGAGTFKIGRGQYIKLNKGVALRGAGPKQTILVNPLNASLLGQMSPVDSTPIVIIGAGRWTGWDGDGRCNGLTRYQTQSMQLLATDASKGATSVTVADGAIFKAGQFVLLDETSGASWQPDLTGIGDKVWATADYSVQWPFFLKGNQASGDGLSLSSIVTPSESNNFAGLGNGSDASCWCSRQDRPQNEIKEVQSVSGNVVTFTSPLHKSYRVANYAELTTATGDRTFVKNAGLEDVSLIGGASAVEFENAAYSWAKNIDASVWWGGILMFGFRLELRDSYIHDGAWPEPGGAGYAIMIAGSELLIENNKSMNANKVIVARSAGAGSVVGYNYMDAGYVSSNNGWIEIGLNASHMVGPHHILFEGNRSFNMDSDDTHGNSTYNTYFRNWATTTRMKFVNNVTSETVDDAVISSGPRRAAGMMRYGRFMSFVGNVLGVPGVTTAAKGYVTEADHLLDQNNGMMWMLGWSDVEPYTADPGVGQTAVRDGNWESATEEQSWRTGAKAVLPDSLYLSGPPAFFDGYRWPWIDPTTGTVYRLPAQDR
jgi:hypothetical protein